MNGPVRRGAAALSLAAVAVLVLVLVLALALAAPTALAQSPSPPGSSSAAPGASAAPGPSATPLLRPAPSPPVGTPFVRTLDGGAGQQLAEVVAWRGGFVASGSVLLWGPPGVGRQTIWTSPDGLAWTEVPDPFGPQQDPLVIVQRLVPFGDVLVAVGSQGRRLLLWTYPDGRRWQRVPDAPVFGSAGVPARADHELGIVGAAATQGRIEIVGTYGPLTPPTTTRIWTSTDGRHWRHDAWTGADPTDLMDLSASGDRFTALIAQARSTSSRRVRTGPPASASSGLSAARHWEMPSQIR